MAAMEQRWAPWKLLDLDRHASASEVKAQFRKISRSMHPDKQTNVKSREAAGLIFPLLQHAYDGMKNNDAKKFRLGAEVNEQLYSASKYVIELTPSSFAANVTNVTSGDVWVIILYSPRCSMSRAIAPIVEMVAERAASQNIRFGAFGCGVHEAAKEDANKRGFTAVFDDPVCKHFSAKETPMIFGTLGDFQVSFGTVMTPGLSDRLLGFSHEAKGRWLRRSLIVDVSAEQMTTEAFNNSFWIVGFRASTADAAADRNIKLVSDSLLAAFTTVASRLNNSGVNVGIVQCKDGATIDPLPTSQFGSPVPVNCTQEGNEWFPNVQIYGLGRGAGQGVSLLREPFGEMRDVEVTLEAMTTTLLITLNVSEVEADPTNWMEEKPEPEESPAQSCSAPPDQPPPLPQAPEITTTQQQPDRPPERKAEQRKLPPKRMTPRVLRHTGGGKVYGGGGGGGGGGLLGN